MLRTQRPTKRRVLVVLCLLLFIPLDSWFHSLLLLLLLLLPLLLLYLSSERECANYSTSVILISLKTPFKASHQHKH